MIRLLLRIAGLSLVLTAASAQAQPALEPPPEQTAPSPAPEPAASPPASPMEVTTLAAPDSFSTPGRATGLAADLWRGAAPATVRATMILLATKPVSPAARQLARRVLATGAPGPAGLGADPDVTAARANALLATGDVRAAAATLERAPGLDRSAELSRAAAEIALLAGDDARACSVGDALTADRSGAYWLRLRTYCQAIAGQGAAAHLTFDLAQAQAKDAVFARLMGAKLAGAGDPGAASARNGLDYALSKSLGLDMAAAKPTPAVAAAMAGADPAPLAWEIPGDLAAASSAAVNGAAPNPAEVAALVAQAATAQDPKARARTEAAALLMAALSPDLGADVRGQLAILTAADGKAPAGRNLALGLAVEQKLVGETAMLALWTCAESGVGGPGLGDRVRIVRALRQVGLEADARAFALEGLAGLK